MRRSFSLLALSISIALAISSDAVAHVVHERRSAGHSGDWSYARKSEADRVLLLRIGLTQQNLHQLDDLLMAVADPFSPSFGKHWSPAQVADHFAPHDDTVTAIQDWLEGAGFASERVGISPGKNWIDVNATVAETERLLKTEYHVFSHLSGAENIGTQSLLSSVRHTSCSFMPVISS